jgi:hypothetical protein
MKNIFFQRHCLIIYGLSLVGIGLFTRYHIGRRRFNRRGIAGLQHYFSYGIGVCTSVIETLLNFIGLLFILSGLFLLAIAGFNHHFTH